MATAADSQGIMALPMEGASTNSGAQSQPQLGLDDSYDAIQEGLQNASPEAYTAVNAELAKLAPQLDQLPDEVLDQLLQIVQYMHDRPEEYAQLLKNLVDEGIVEEGDFPEEYDPEFLATFGMVLMQARKTRQAAQQGAMPVQQAPVPPVGMARGGIAEAARMVANRGRNGDTLLAHITPEEAQLLRSRGGAGTINPQTGLPEFFNPLKIIKDTGKAAVGVVTGAVKGVVGAVKTVLKSPIGKVLATAAIAYFAAPLLTTMAPTLLTSGSAALAGASMAAASGAVTALSGGGIKDILKSAAVGGATAFFGAPGGVVSNFVGGAVTNAAANAAISSGIVGTGMGLLSGQKLQDAVKSGLTAGAVSGLTTGFSKGFTRQIEAPKVGTSPIDAQTANAGEVKGPTVASELRNQSDVNSSYTGKPSAGPAYDTGFGPGTNAFENSSYTGRTSNVGPTDIGFTPPTAFTGPAAPAPASPPSPAYDPRSFTGSLKDIGGGISDIAQGNFSTGFDQLGTGAKNLFLPSAPSPSEVMGSQEYSDLIAKGISPDKALDMVTKSMSPGIFRTFAPGVAAGLGVMGLAGGYEQKQPEPTALQRDIEDRLARDKAEVEANPGAYTPKGMERFGIIYNEKGEIAGSRPFNPQPAGPVNVAAKDYLADYSPTPPTYNAPANAVSTGASIYQPYNTASMYTNLMPPQYRADGGIASLARGGYPRRTGQISGPGTETSDSIPAMLSDGEFVMTARAVRGAGKGNRLAGAKKMYALMHQLERNAARG